MKEEVFSFRYYSSCYRVDRQLLASLEDIFEDCHENLEYIISVECSNSMGYVFENSDELCETFEKKQYRIVKLSFEASYGEKYNKNKVEITFDNNSNRSKVLFNLNSNDDLMLLQGKIDSCLKNSKLSYSIISKTPLAAVALSLFFIILCVYTWINNIVYPESVQSMIVSLYFLGCVLLSFSPFADKLKRKLFPHVEFRIGTNTIIEEKHEKIRNFIFGTVLVGVIIGIIGNIISQLFF